MAACLFFANSLSAEEIQTYTMEEKQEMYEAAMSDEDEDEILAAESEALTAKN